MPINTQLSMNFDENTNTDVDMDMDYDGEEDSFMEGFSFESSQPQVDVVSWQNSQPSRDLMELAQRVPNRRNFKHKPTPTLLWDDYTSSNQQSSSSTGTISSTSHSGHFSRSSSLPGPSFSKSGQSSSTSASSSSRPDENTAPAPTKKPPIYFAPVEATTVKLRRATTTQHLPRAMPASTSVGRSEIRHSSTSSLQYGGTKGKEREMAKPRRSEPVPAPAPGRMDINSTRNIPHHPLQPHLAHQPDRNPSGRFTRSLSSSSSTSSHPSSVDEEHTRGNTPDTSMSMDVDCSGSQGSGSGPTSNSAKAAQILASLPKPQNLPKSKPNVHPPPTQAQAEHAKHQATVRLHPLLLQKTSSTSSTSSSSKPHSPIIPSPSQSHSHPHPHPPIPKQPNAHPQQPPPLTQSARRPALGMCRRTHTFPSSSQQSGSGAGTGTGVKKFRPPLLSQLPQSQSQAGGSRPSTTAAASMKSPPQPKAFQNQSRKAGMDRRQRSPSPEPGMEADSSFGDMSFDMDALEETMKQYD